MDLHKLETNWNMKAEEKFRQSLKKCAKCFLQIIIFRRAATKGLEDLPHPNLIFGVLG